MTDDPLVGVAAAVQVVTAVGIGLFWLTWFRQPHTEEWLLGAGEVSSTGESWSRC